jgi:hypothetical protein
MKEASEYLGSGYGEQMPGSSSAGCIGFKEESISLLSQSWAKEFKALYEHKLADLNRANKANKSLKTVARKKSSSSMRTALKKMSSTMGLLSPSAIKKTQHSRGSSFEDKVVAGAGAGVRERAKGFRSAEITPQKNGLDFMEESKPLLSSPANPSTKSKHVYQLGGYGSRAGARARAMGGTKVAGAESTKTGRAVRARSLSITELAPEAAGSRQSHVSQNPESTSPAKLQK